jgi:hypothetical protein
MIRPFGKYDGAPIRNKEHSKQVIEALGINTADNILVTTIDPRTIEFLRRYDLYGVRYMTVAQPSQYGLIAQEAIAYLRQHLPEHKLFRVEQSMKDRDANNLLLQGEFFWDCDAHAEQLTGMYTLLRGRSLKDINSTGQPITPWCERDWRFRRVLDVLRLYNLRNVVVELTLYNCGVGMYRDDYICWELRNQY